MKYLNELLENVKLFKKIIKLWINRIKWYKIAKLIRTKEYYRII